MIETPLGKGKVVGLNILERVLQVEIPEQERVLEYTLDEIIKRRCCFCTIHRIMRWNQWIKKKFLIQ